MSQLGLFAAGLQPCYHRRKTGVEGLGDLGLSETADTVAIVRDVILILGFLLAVAALFLIYRKVSGILDSVRRALSTAEEVVEAVSSNIVGPAAAGSGVAFGAGKFAAFVLGLRGRNKKQGGGNSNGKQ